MTTNVDTLLVPQDAALAGLIIISLIASKIASGYLGARLARFPSRVSFGMGVMTIPQMSTTLATASIAASYGIFSDALLAGLVVLSMVTITIAPFLTGLVFQRETRKPSRFEKLWRGI